MIPWERLLAAATAVREHAYAPYSGFAVGAAILMEDGSIHAGANVENCIPTLGVCAERVALAAAVSAGLRRPQAVAVVTAADPPAYPCGLCRQALNEFAGGSTAALPIVVTNLEGARFEVRLADLLPHPFHLAPNRHLA